MVQNTARGTPARVIILFALLTGAVAVVAWRDREPGESGGVRYPTAIGDTTYFKPGSEPLHIAIQGSVFMLAEENGDLLQCRDDRMWRVPLAVPQPRLYTTTESFPADEIPPLYLKTGPGEYVRVTLRKESTKPQEPSTKEAPSSR